MPRILIAAGEVSGDALGAGLVGALAETPNLEFSGLAGPRMRAAGVQALAHSEELNVMGVVEVLGSLPRIHKVLRTMRGALTEDVDLLVVIDAPDFNMRLAKTAGQRGIPVMFFGSPQVWAWRQARAKTIAEMATEVLCFFPFEPAYYEKHGGRACFVGHPGVKDLKPLPMGAKGLALLPGSRAQELSQLVGPMGRIAQSWLVSHPGQEIHVAMAPGLSEEAFSKWDFEFRVHNTVSEALAESCVALTCSGTATLEIACLQRPQVVIYRMNPLSFRIIRSRVKGIEHIALPNLLTDPFVQEFVQDWEEEAVLDALLEAEQGGAQTVGMQAVRGAVAGGGYELAAERVHFWLNAD
jgi:lipid-A-disaccharide synthase